MSAATAEDDGLAGWVVDVMEVLGAPGAGLLIALESVFPPMPSEVVLPLAGFAAGRGHLSLTSALVWTTAGSLVGALVLYGLAAWFGPDRVRGALVRLPLVTEGDVDRAQGWFDRHGERAVLLGRMVPLVRSLVSLPAGAARMPLSRFVLLTTLGSATWNSIFVLAGYWLGDRWSTVERYVAPVQYAVIAALVLSVGWFVVRRVRRLRSAPEQ